MFQLQLFFCSIVTNGTALQLCRDTSLSQELHYCSQRKPVNNISVISQRSVLEVEKTSQQYFSYIIAVSFRGGGNQSTIFQLYHSGQFQRWRKPVNNISVISQRTVLEVEETRDLLQATDKLYHILLYRIHCTIGEIPTHNISGNRNAQVVINPTTI